MLQPEVPFVTFSLDGTKLKITTLSGGRRGERDGVQEGPCLDLKELDARGPGVGINDVGNYLFGFLTIEHPEIMNQFKNMAVHPARGPSIAELDKMDEELRRADSGPES